ncbi:MAG TPA: hypothetical protein VKE88_02550 [Candidatus Nanoarchaeia archaeon]|nr:hypothetical protein [Candidatus Nanoarchaeia archaeon]
MFEHMNFAPLPSGFMAVSILGLFIVAIYRETLQLPWTFTLSLFFIILFISSFISLHYGPFPERKLDREY